MEIVQSGACPQKLAEREIDQLLQLRSPAAGVMIVEPAGYPGEKDRELRTALKDLGEIRPSFRLVLNLRKVDFADGEMIGIIQALHMSGHELALCGVCQRVRDKLATKQMHHLLERIHSGETEAAGLQPGEAAAGSAGRQQLLREQLAARLAHRLLLAQAQDAQLEDQTKRARLHPRSWEIAASGPAFDVSPAEQGACLASCRFPKIVDGSRAHKNFEQELKTLSSAAVTSESNVLLDLSQVEHIGSQSLGNLIALQRQLNHHGLRLAVVAPEGGARRAFEVSQLDKVLSLHETTAQAMLALAQPAETAP